MMNLSQALSKARWESRIEQRGKGWSLVVYDGRLKSDRCSVPGGAAALEVALTTWRVARTLSLLGWSEHEAQSAALADLGESELEGKVLACLRVKEAHDAVSE